MKVRMTWMLDRWGSFMPVKGRVLLSLLFIISGGAKLMGFGGFVGYVASFGLPAASVVAGLVVAIELLGASRSFLDTMRALPRTCSVSSCSSRFSWHTAILAIRCSSLQR